MQFLITMYEINEQQIRLWWQVFNPQNKLVEIRLLGKNTYSGYFKDIETLLYNIKPLLDYNNEHYYGSLQAYFTLNEINDDLYSREQKDKFVKKPKSTTNDSDIVRRRMVLIDFDPCRSSGISASEEELKKAHLKAIEVYRYLIEQGFNQPIVTKSGNGWHLYLPCDMPNDEEHNQTIKRFLQSLSKMFGDNDIELDEKVFNPARIDKLVGTWAKKGSDSEERKWRIAEIVKIPNDLSPNQDELFEKIANLLPKEEPKVLPNRRQNYNVSFDLVAWLNTYGIKYREKTIGNSICYELYECPFIDQHSDKKNWDSALFVDSNGKVTFNCHHNHCKDKTWHDVRLHYEPDAYNKPQYQPTQRIYKSAQIKPQYEVKKEDNELGSKWKSLSSIKKIDLSSLEKARTGFTELDKAIGGLHFSEITILSGSNACVDCDTEYFNGVEWKKISEYQLGEKVLQYNENGTANLVYPQRYIKEPCKTLHLIKTKQGVNQCLSDEHTVVYQTSKGNLCKKQMKDLIAQHNNSKNGFNGKFYTTFKYGGKGIDLSDEQIRVMCAVICDGCFTNKFRDKSIVRLNLKKQAKKERLERLLKEANIEYRKEQYNPKDLEYNNYFFKAPRIEKEFGAYWYDCSSYQLSVIADEIMYWDGCLSYGSYSSTSKANIDFMQLAFASIGKRTSIYIDNRVGRKHSNSKYEYKSICYDLNICSNNMVSMLNYKNKTQIQDYLTKDGYKYCFTVPSGMLVLRRGGNINITGNCGKSSWLNTLMFNIVEQDYKVALWSGELNDSILKAWIQMVGAGKTFLNPSQFGDGKYYVPNNIGESIDEWLEGKFFLYNNEYGSKWEQLFNDMNEIYEQGVRVFILDNLMALDIDLFDGDKNNKQKELILQLKDFAKKKNVHIILVAHPRKSLTFLRKQDISGSADLTNLADNVFIMHRNNNDFQKALDEYYGKGANVEFMDFGNVLSVEKNRMYGVEKMVGMYFEKESRRFLNTSNEDVKYGWVDLHKQKISQQYYKKPPINQQNEAPFGALENGNPFEEEKYIFD